MGDWLLNSWYLPIVALSASFWRDITRGASTTDAGGVGLKGGGSGIDEGCRISDLTLSDTRSGANLANLLDDLAYSGRWRFVSSRGFGGRRLAILLGYLSLKSPSFSTSFFIASAGIAGALLLMRFITWSISLSRFLSRVLEAMLVVVRLDWSRLDYGKRVVLSFAPRCVSLTIRLSSGMALKSVELY